MHMQFWPLDRFVRYARELRKNNHALPRIVQSIKEFGFQVPVLVTAAGEVIDGHLRLKGAEALGMTQVPVVICEDLTEVQIKSFRLLVNRSAEWGNGTSTW